MGRAGRRVLIIYFLRGSNLQRLCYRKFIVRLGRPLADFDAGALHEDLGRDAVKKSTP